MNILESASVVLLAACLAYAIATYRIARASKESVQNAQIIE